MQRDDADLFAVQKTLQIAVAFQFFFVDADAFEVIPVDIGFPDFCI
jgi:hypothetical protein